VVLTALVAAAVSYALLPREPVYQGKKLSLWLDELRHDLPKEDHRTAEEAVRKIGTKALPYLFQMIRQPEQIETKVRSLKVRMKRLVGLDSSYDLALSFASEAERYLTVIIAFRALGPIAEPALPELTNLLQNTDTSFIAASALAGIGPAALPPLTNALQNSDLKIRADAAGAVGFLGADALPALPGLLSCLRDDDKRVRLNAASSLGEVGRVKPEAVVPALLNTLRNTNTAVRVVTAEALGKIGGEAKAAVPALVELLRDGDSRVRLAATNAMRQIDPQSTAISLE